jgi:hypothetical protein
MLAVAYASFDILTPHRVIHQSLQAPIFHIVQPIVLRVKVAFPAVGHPISKI